MEILAGFLNHQEFVVCWFIYSAIWVFPKIGLPQNGWFTRENPIKMDDLGVPLYLETPIWHCTKSPCSKFFQLTYTPEIEALEAQNQTRPKGFSPFQKELVFR